MAHLLCSLQPLSQKRVSMTIHLGLSSRLHHGECLFGCRRGVPTDTHDYRGVIREQDAHTCEPFSCCSPQPRGPYSACGMRCHSLGTAHLASQSPSSGPTQALTLATTHNVAHSPCLCSAHRQEYPRKCAPQICV